MSEGKEGAKGEVVISIEDPSSSSIGLGLGISRVKAGAAAGPVDELDGC